MEAQPPNIGAVQGAGILPPNPRRGQEENRKMGEAPNPPGQTAKGKRTHPPDRPALTPRAVQPNHPARWNMPAAGRAGHQLQGRSPPGPGHHLGKVTWSMNLPAGRCKKALSGLRGARCFARAHSSRRAPLPLPPAQTHPPNPHTPRGVLNMGGGIRGIRGGRAPRPAGGNYHGGQSPPNPHRWNERESSKNKNPHRWGENES